MKSIWKFYDENELLTVEEQNIQQNQQNMSIGFWIGITTCIILLSLILLISHEN